MARVRKSIENLPIPPGQVDPETGFLVLDPQRTKPTALAFIKKHYMRHGLRTLHCYRDELFIWRDNHYAAVEAGVILKELLTFLDGAGMYGFPKSSGPPTLVPFKANPQTVNAVLDTLRSVTHLDIRTEVPAWLSSERRTGKAADFLAFKSSLVHVHSGLVVPATPSYFTLTALPFEYRATPPSPKRWLRFLDELFGEDLQSIQVLQEWFGYALTLDTWAQKAIFIVGPKRSGKGTIGRVLRQLVGPFNVVNPTTTGLAGTFGLQPLLGKSLAIISDARFRGDQMNRLTEIVLNITGEDSLTVERKFLSAVTVKLSTRMVFFSNELPRLSDASGALASRFLILKLTKSFYDREDHTLTDDLMKELPGILKWALEGLKRLRTRGRFVQPASSHDDVQELEELSSPIIQFVREQCEIGVNFRTDVAMLFNAWLEWCQTEHLDHPGTRTSFGRNLHAAFPQISRRRGTGDVGFYDGIGLKSTGAPS